MKKMNKSIDDIILSIRSNDLAIDDMLNTAKAHNASISGTMHGYAASHSVLNTEQISAYADYAREYDCIRQFCKLPINRNRLENINNIHNEELLYSMLDEIHTEQISFMERLCTVIEKAGKALKLLCANN